MLLPLTRFALLSLLASLACEPAAPTRPIAAMSVPAPVVAAEKFRLSASPCAAKGYPMTIQFGAFVRPDGKTFPVPSGHTLEGRWGLSSISWAVGDELQPVPDSLEILYFSYLEDTFYDGRFPLPRPRLTELLHTGFWDHRKQQQVNYDELTVCVLPKGAVVVWLTGPGRQVLVGRYQGQPAGVDFQRFYPQSDRAEMRRQKLAAAPPAIRAQAQAGQLSARQWDEYLLTYSWQVAFSQPLKLTYYRANFLSGEYVAEPETRDLVPYLQAAVTPHQRPVPKQLVLHVSDEAGHRYWLKVEQLDEAQTQQAFRQLHQAHPGQPLTLRVETDKYLKAATLVLEAGGQRLPLDKSSVKVTAL